MAGVVVGVVPGRGSDALGRQLVEALGSELGRDAVVEPMPPSAVAGAGRIEALMPEALILVGTAGGGRPPGTVERRRISSDAQAAPVGPDEVRTGTGVDLLLRVAAGRGVLPARTVAIEIEPAAAGAPAERRQVDAELGRALALVRAEVRRIPLLAHADQIRASIADGHLGPGRALDAMASLLGELRTLDVEGRWGRAFAERDRLRVIIAGDDVGEGVTYLDWGLWWGLIEELDRLQGLEAVER